MTRSPAYRVIRGMLVAIGILAVAIGILIATFQWNWLKKPLEKQISAVTGRELVILGELTGNWNWDWSFDLRPELRAETVQLSNPQWATDRQFLEAQAVEFRLQLIPLIFTRRIHLDSLAFEAPQISMERIKDGRATWYFDLEQKDPDAAPVIDHLRVSNGSLRYRALDDGTDVTASLKEDASADAQRALSFEGKGRINKMPFEVKGATASLLVLRNLNDKLPIEARGLLAETKFSVEGTVEGIQRFERAELKYRLEGPSLATLGDMFSAPIPNTPKYRITGMLHHSPGIWATDDLSGWIGGTDLAGAVSLNTAEKKPFLKVKLDSRRMDLADLGPLIGYASKAAVPPAAGKATTTSAQAVQTGKILPVYSLEMKSIDKIDAQVLINARQVVRAGGFPFDNFMADFRLKDSRITIDPLQFGMADGALRVRVEMDARGPVTARVKGGLKGMRLARIFENNKFGAAGGVISGFIDLKGSGKSVAAMVGNASGSIGAVLNDGRVPALWPALADLDGMRILSSLQKEKDPNKESVVCTAVAMEVEKGIATPKVGVIETDTTVLTLAGTANLAEETFDLRLLQAPKKASFLSIRTPITVTGPMRKPKLGLEPGPLSARAAAGIGLALVNPLLALLATIETGPGKEGTCPEIRNALTQQRNADRGQEAATVAKPAPKS